MKIVQMIERMYWWLEDTVYRIFGPDDMPEADGRAIKREAE